MHGAVPPMDPPSALEGIVAMEVNSFFYSLFFLFLSQTHLPSNSGYGTWARGGRVIYLTQKALSFETTTWIRMEGM